MANDIDKAVRAACLWLPEASEAISHGSPIFKVRGKTFAMYLVNHHGDGRVALWLSAPKGAQALYTREEPKHFFIPKYMGHNGWIALDVTKQSNWQEVRAQLLQSYRHFALKRMLQALGDL